VLALIGLLWYTKSLNAQKLEEELEHLRKELAKVSRQPRQIQPSEQEQELKQQVEALQAQVDQVVAEKKSVQVSMAEEKQAAEQVTRVVSEEKMAAEHARDELIAENHKLCTQLSSEQNQNQNHQSKLSKINLTTEQLREQNSKLASQLAIEQSHKNIALERVKEVEEKVEMMNALEKENASNSGVARLLSKKHRNDVPISPRDRPMLSPRENRASRGLGCSVEASGLLSPREIYHRTEFGAGLESTDAGYSTYDSVSPGAMRTPERSSRSGSSEMGAGMGIGWTP